MDLLKTRHREMLLLQACLAAKQSFVVDNTNVTSQERGLYIALAKQAGFRVIGYYFPSTLEAASRRNGLRSGRALVPEKGIRGRLSQLEPPAFSEGYDRLFTVRIDPKTSQFLVEELKNG
jgi:predicted kinase